MPCATEGSLSALSRLISVDGPAQTAQGSQTTSISTPRRPPGSLVASSSALKSGPTLLQTSTNSVSSPEPSDSDAREGKGSAPRPDSASHSTGPTQFNPRLNAASNLSLEAKAPQSHPSPQPPTEHPTFTALPIPTSARDRGLGNDPLSKFSVAARQIMLKIMDSGENTSDGRVHVKIIARSLSGYQSVTPEDIE